jgi:AmmeMemoRadiSam system protein A
MTDEYQLSECHQRLLLDLAHQSIAHGLTHHAALPLNPSDFPEELRESRPVFVTLNLHGELRGCIGTLEYSRPLVANVAQYAYASAFSDPRFPPLSDSELPLIKIHISILGPLQPMTFSSELDLLAQIRPGQDGLLLEDGFHRGTLLPSVWEDIPRKEEFLERLKIKAGLAGDYWSDQIRVKRYTAFCCS